MDLRNNFIKATENYNTFENHVPAYYFRRAYNAKAKANAKITIAVCGLYEIYLNGKNITKGFLSPYFNNTNDFIYYDEYEVTLDEGENVIGVWLGNGFHNDPAGYIWEFDKSPFRSAPMFSLTLSEGDEVLLHSGEGFKTHSSPILYDDYRFGEYYDASCELDGWCNKGFDDSDWANVLTATAPGGELRKPDIAPIVKECEIAPVEIIPCEDGYIYDFGISNAGVCRLTINGAKGQKVEIQHADSLKDGDLNILQVWFDRPTWERDVQMVHKDTYVCRGNGTEIYEPRFTYHGFRYVKVTGVTPEQATKELLTYLVYHTELHSMGDFTCSDKTASLLQEMTRRSIVSNFHHFPTDCPQREKNGWTADAALSSEAALLNFDPEKNYREWMRNICKAQRADGALPGIVPTGGWGFDWGNGPAWDSVLTYLPYFTYLYRGKTEMITESAEYMIKYLRYLRTRCDENGLLAIGLGDWCDIGEYDGKPSTPLIVTDSIITMDIANKIAFMLNAIGMNDGAEYARGEAAKYRAAIRANLVDFDTMLVLGNYQTAQAMGLFYGVFDESEKAVAFERLLELVHKYDDHMYVGVLGGRVLFHVLSDFGYSDLAFKMITREDFPSYGNWIARGATTLWEDFFPDMVHSMNHHFWGDISAWFIKRIAGIQLNPERTNVNEVRIAPNFITCLDNASAHHIAPAGKISSEWVREGDAVTLKVEIPEGMSAVAELEDGYAFEDGASAKTITSGAYKVVRV